MRTCFTLLMLVSGAAYARQDAGLQAAQQAQAPQYAQRAAQITPQPAPKPGTSSTSPTAEPKFSPKPGTYLPTKYVIIKDSTPGAAIYYTSNGSAPTASSPRYTGPLPVASTTTLRAIAIAPKHSQSVEASGVYQVKSKPLLSVLGGG